MTNNQCFATGHGGLLVGSESRLKGTGGLIRYKNDGTQETLIDRQNIYCLLVDDTGRIWVGADKGVLHRNDGEEDWSLINFSLNGDDKQVSSIVVDPESPNNMFIGTVGAGIAFYQARRFQTMLTQDNSKLSSNTIKRLVADEMGNLWAEVEVIINGAFISKMDCLDIQY